MKRTALRRTGIARVSPRQRIKLQLDELARFIMFTKHGAYLLDGTRTWMGRCLKCNNSAYLQWCHVFSRGIEATRWDEDNAWPGCFACHDLWWHRRVQQVADDPHEWWREQIGRIRYNALKLRAATNRNADLKLWRVKLETEAKRLGWKTQGDGGARVAAHGRSMTHEPDG